MTMLSPASTDVSAPQTVSTESTQLDQPQAPTKEAVTEPQTVAKPEGTDTDLSKQFAALARKEKAILDRERKAAELEKRFGKYGQVKPKDNPLAWLETGEITIEELIQAKLKEGKPPTAEERTLTVEEKLAKLEKQLADKDAASKQEHIDREVQKFRDSITALVDSDKVKFELILAHGAQNEVYNVCELYYNENHHKPDFKPLDISKAAELVEDQLFSEAKEKYSKVAKYKSLFVPTEQAPDTNKATDTPKPTTTEPTLTNRGTTPSAPSTKTLSREKAIAMIASRYDR